MLLARYVLRRLDLTLDTIWFVAIELSEVLEPISRQLGKGVLEVLGYL